MEPSGRPCEICGKDDLDCYVVSSSIGGFSQNICGCCSAMGAESAGFSKEYGSNSYNSIDDRYYDSSDNHIPIKMKSGVEYDTRSEAVESMNKKG